MTTVSGVKTSLTTLTDDSTDAKRDRNDPSFMPYVYICVGIAVLVVIVTAFSFFCLHAYNGE